MGIEVRTTYDSGKFENQLMGRYGSSAQNKAITFMQNNPLTEQMLVGAASCRERCRAKAYRYRLRAGVQEQLGNNDESAMISEKANALQALANQLDSLL